MHEVMKTQGSDLEPGRKACCGFLATLFSSASVPQGPGPRTASRMDGIVSAGQEEGKVMGAKEL